MDISTSVTQKYFNDAVSKEETEKYRKLIINNFKYAGMVAFGQIKFLLKSPPRSDSDYDFRTIDNLVNFAAKNKIRLQYNTVINNKNSFPDWYWKLTSGEKLKFLEKHIKTIIRKYKNNFYLFKLVNECVRDNEENFLGTDKKKSDLITRIFIWAKEESPGSLFMINDFGSFFNRDVRKKYIGLVRNVIKSGGPVDVLGEEGHIWPFKLPSDKVIRETLKELHSASGLPLYITEFDLSYDDTLYGGGKIDPFGKFETGGKTYKNWFEYQSHAYRHFLDITAGSGIVDNLTFWGLSDQNAVWERPGTGLFDENLNPKPAYFAVKDKLEKIKEVPSVL